MELITIIIDALWLAFGFWLGTKLFEKIKPIKEKDNFLSKETIILSQIKKIATLKTEIHEDVVFAFDAGNGTFIAQGASIDEVAEAAYKYRKIDLAYVLHLGQPMWFMNGKVTTTDIQLI